MPIDNVPFQLHPYFSTGSRNKVKSVSLATTYIQIQSNETHMRTQRCFIPLRKLEKSIIYFLIYQECSSRRQHVLIGQY